MGAHGAVASQAFGDEKLVDAVLADYRTAPISEPLRATLAFLEKLTLHPEDVGPEDVVPLHALGLSDQALEDAIQVCTLFNIITRAADSFGFDLPSSASFHASARMLLKRGYL